MEEDLLIQNLGFPHLYLAAKLFESRYDGRKGYVHVGHRGN